MSLQPYDSKWKELVAILNLFGVLGNTQNQGLPIIGIAATIASFQAIKATRKYNKEK